MRQADRRTTCPAARNLLAHAGHSATVEVMTMYHDTQHDEWAYRAAQGLGWFSIGLGVAELAAPGTLARLIGTRRHDTLVRAYGAREIIAGLGLLSGRQPATWLWARVAGDVLDLATLRLAAEERGADAERIGVASAAVVGVTALDLVTALHFSSSSGN